MSVYVPCVPGCNFKDNLCLKQVEEIVETGSSAYMLYSEHIKSAIDDLGYNYTIKYAHDIFGQKFPALIFITE